MNCLESISWKWLPTVCNSVWGGRRGGVCEDSDDSTIYCVCESRRTKIIMSFKGINELAEVAGVESE